VQTAIKSTFGQLLNSWATLVPVTPLVVFTHPRALIEVHDAPIPVIPVAKLRKQIPTNLPKMSPELYQEVQAVLDKMVA
jgi:hypothetical protein